MFALAWALCATGASGADCFAIRVVDEATGRGVPLVALRTVDGTVRYTDSAGFVAVRDPELMGQRVFFHISSHGYEYPADGFGNRGIALDVTPGGRAEVRVHRVNIAERLYRLTGAGIYRDSVILGEPVPVRQPLLNARVTGQDSALAIPWRGRIYWFFGDTNRIEYPLGNFHTSGATSALPGDGGLDPSIGVDIEYLVDDDGFSRAMCPMAGEGPVWLDGLAVARDRDGADRLVAHYSRVRGLETLLEHGLAVFDDERQVFTKHVEFALDDTQRCPRGHPVAIREDGRDWLLFPTPFASLRCEATIEALSDPGRYESFTCLAPGARFAAEHTAVERGPDGTLVWGWKPNTDAITQAQEAELAVAGLLRPDECRYQVRDGTGQAIRLHNGSLAWNAYRQRWIMIVAQAGGSSSVLGEIWFAEADSPTGPWTSCTKIVTHDHYGLYNPVHHPFLDQDGGRVIYFQGTYSQTFEGPVAPTPLYDYNQIMYRLDLSDARLGPPPSRR
ncbi:MAG TPA: hypothetical protein PLD23_00015 [Armatimonadota bacterium]|nr:hypothetical protein [Armatimonadota bacterium]HQK91857.1 hypothetical protein [Armatimonadota bacterium]